jgi:pyridoxal 5'-phosphate synthase pdxT subunit
VGPVTVGVLALQGDFEAHAAVLRRLGAEPRAVRTPADLAGLDAIVIPGGESTSMTLGIDRDHLGLLDVRARRNAFGRQLRSFEAPLELSGLRGGPIDAVFIRAPWVDEHGERVEVLAEVDGHPVAVREGHVLAVAFHPELTDDARVHLWLVEQARAAAERRRAGEEAAA